jgi:ureidoglycolate lyase
VKRLELKALTAESFSAFGDVIDGQAPCERYPINEGRTARHHAIANIDCAEQNGTAALSLFRAQPVEDEFVLRVMERHPLGSQSFINTSGNRYAIVVAPRGELDEQAIEGFLAQPGQSVSYHRGTWHHYLLALDAPSDFVVVDRIGPGDNCDEQILQQALQLQIPAQR